MTWVMVLLRCYRGVQLTAMTAPSVAGRKPRNITNKSITLTRDHGLGVGMFYTMDCMHSKYDS